MPTVAELKAAAKAKVVDSVEAEEADTDLIAVDSNATLNADTLKALSRIDTLPILFSVSEELITEVRNRVALLKADSKESYKLVRGGLSTCRKLRVLLDKQRMELKRPTLDFGDRVDSRAKELRLALEAIEKPLKAERERYEEEEARKLKEAKDAEEAARQEKIRQEREAEDARLKDEREKLAREREAQRLERARIDDELKKIQDAKDEQQRELQAARDRIAQELKEAQDRIDNDRREVEQAKAKLKQDEEDRQRKAREAEEQAERERAAAIKAEQDRKKAEAKAERDRLAEIERQRIEAERLEALRPDIEKIHRFGESLASLELPAMATTDGLMFIESIETRINEMAAACTEYVGQVW